MEIILQGWPVYKIPEWNGTCEVQSFRLYQYKRVANSRNAAAVFRKLVKIISAVDSPVTLPKGLKVEDIAINDFMQLTVGISAVRNRSIQRTFVCEAEKDGKKCGAQNPRVIDILKVFKPVAPVNKEGRLTIDLNDSKAKDAVKDPIDCRYISIGDYLKGQDLEELAKEELAKRFGDVFPFDDEEDVDDFRSMIQEVATVAAAIEYKKKTWDEKIKWLLGMQGDDLKKYRKLADTIHDLGPTITSTYKDECQKCKNEFEVELSPADYFFVTE